jgi:hypothetical protein
LFGAQGVAIGGAAAAGVVAETCALMFDRDGRPVKGLDDRRIGTAIDLATARLLLDQRMV